MLNDNFEVEILVISCKYYLRLEKGEVSLGRNSQQRCHGGAGT